MNPDFDDRKQETEALDYEAQSQIKRLRVLVVDDDRIMRMMMEERVQELDHETLSAVNGKDAYDLLLKEKHNIDLLLLDREMPEMNGMEVVKRMKANADLRRIPIIMATGSDRPEQIKEGIDAGVFYYLTKPFDQDVFKAVFLSAVRELETRSVLKEELKKHKSSFNLIDTAAFTIHTISEAEDLSAFLANIFPDPERVIAGLAELMINGIEHGNLGLTYEEKTDLIERGMWRHEIDYRCTLPKNKHKKVQVIFRRNEDGLYVKIEDDGDGFDWRRYLDIDPARAKDNHGRGIAQARAVSFDALKYNTAGNVATAIVREEEELQW